MEAKTIMPSSAIERIECPDLQPEIVKIVTGKRTIRITRDTLALVGLTDPEAIVNPPNRDGHLEINPFTMALTFIGFNRDSGLYDSYALGQLTWEQVTQEFISTLWCVNNRFRSWR